MQKFAVILFACLLLCGCDSGPDRGMITGKVTYNGQPLTFGAVQLQPVDGGTGSHGKIQPDGSFTIKGLVEGEGAEVGEHVVSVSCYEANDPKNAGRTFIGLGKSYLPEDYTRGHTSGIKVDVKPGENPPLNIDLVD